MKAVMLTRNWAYSPPIVHIGDFRVRFARSVQYLGVQLDTRCDFGTHFREWTAISAAVFRLLLNTNGPTAVKRRLFAMVVYAKLLYASEVWAHTAMSAVRNKVVLDQPARSVALRTIRAYQIVSIEAAMFLPRFVLADIVVIEKESVATRSQSLHGYSSALAQIKAEKRRRSMERWQWRWEELDTASWTRRRFSEVAEWFHSRAWTSLSFTTMQSFTGHCVFRA